MGHQPIDVCDVHLLELLHGQQLPKDSSAAVLELAVGQIVDPDTLRMIMNDLAIPCHKVIYDSVLVVLQPDFEDEFAVMDL